jgi:hypothetical protein
MPVDFLVATVTDGYEIACVVASSFVNWNTVMCVELVVPSWTTSRSAPLTLVVVALVDVFSSSVPV